MHYYKTLFLLSHKDAYVKDVNNYYYEICKVCMSNDHKKCLVNQNNKYKLYLGVITMRIHIVESNLKNVLLKKQ